MSGRTLKSTVLPIFYFILSQSFYLLLDLELNQPSRVSFYTYTQKLVGLALVEKTARILLTLSVCTIPQRNKIVWKILPGSRKYLEKRNCKMDRLLKTFFCNRLRTFRSGHQIYSDSQYCSRTNSTFSSLIT